MVLPYVWILDASDAPWTLQTLQNLALARLWALCETAGGVAQTVGSGLWRAKSFFLVAQNCPSNPSNPSNASTLANGSAIRLDSGRFRRSKTSHLLDCGLLALCETVGGVAQTVGSGLCGPKLPFKPLKPLKRCHTSGFWTLQTLHGRFRRSKT